MSTLVIYSCLPFILNCYGALQTRLQGTTASQYTGTFDCLKQVLSKEGIGALYAGVIPRMGRVVPGQGIIFMSFETIVSNLEKFTIFQ